jgi:hypothetical protein
MSEFYKLRNHPDAEIRACIQDLRDSGLSDRVIARMIPRLEERILGTRQETIVNQVKKRFGLPSEKEDEE